MGFSLPTDIVAVDDGDRSYMFYVSKETNKLSYLISPDPTGAGDFTSQVVELTDENNKKKDVTVSPTSQQVAAITWDNQKSKTTHIRVYYVNSKGNLSEACRDSDKPSVWYQGSLGDLKKTQWAIADASSLSAVVHKSETKRDLRVYASGKDQKNHFGNPNISVYRFVYDETSKNDGNWNPPPISNEIQAW